MTTEKTTAQRVSTFETSMNNQRVQLVDVAASYDDMIKVVEYKDFVSEQDVMDKFAAAGISIAAVNKIERLY